MTDSYRIRLECEKCHRGMILTIRAGSLIYHFECDCGHTTTVRDLPAMPSVQPAGDE